MLLENRGCDSFLQAQSLQQMEARRRRLVQPQLASPWQRFMLSNPPRRPRRRGALPAAVQPRRPQWQLSTFRPDRNVTSRACEMHGYFDLTGARRSTHVYFAVCVLQRLQTLHTPIHQYAEAVVTSEQIFARPGLLISSDLEIWQQFKP